MLKCGKRKIWCVVAVVAVCRAARGVAICGVSCVVSHGRPTSAPRTACPTPCRTRLCACVLRAVPRLLLAPVCRTAADVVLVNCAIAVRAPVLSPNRLDPNEVQEISLANSRTLPWP